MPRVEKGCIGVKGVRDDTWLTKLVAHRHAGAPGPTAPLRAIGGHGPA
jgi:hypothetical protein